MPEFVTVARLGGPNEPARRMMNALAQRLGNGAQVRTLSQRDADAAKQTLDGAMARLGIVSVEQHVCNHDIGDGDCR